MISKERALSYCKDFTKIENYEKAINDKTQTWVCHHRLESCFHSNFLKKTSLYYNVEPEALIFLTKKEHQKQKHAGKKCSDETKRKMSEARKGKHNNKGENNPMYGKHHSEETRKKISEANIGQPSCFKGHHHSEETKQKLREAHLGKAPWNKGKTYKIGDKNVE